MLNQLTILSVLEQFEDSAILSWNNQGVISDALLSISGLYCIFTAVEGELVGDTDEDDDEIFDPDDEGDDEFDDEGDELMEEFLEEQCEENQYIIEMNEDTIAGTFLAIMVANIAGLTPDVGTSNAQLIVAFGLSFGVFFGALATGIQLHGINILSLFLTSGTPLAMAFFLVPLEMLSYTARLFSLAIRLFANLLAGGCLLKIITGFAWTMLLTGSTTTLFAILPCILIIVITIFELIVGYLQAYIFTMLSSIYSNEAVWLH